MCFKAPFLVTVNAGGVWYFALVNRIGVKRYSIHVSWFLRFLVLSMLVCWVQISMASEAIQ